MPNKRPHEQGHLESRDGSRLYYEADVAESPKAVLLFIHGFAEHCGRYRDMASALCEAGYSSYRVDLRGHGGSEGRRGHIYRFDEYVDDFEALRAHGTAALPDGCPVYVLAHSYGGLVGLHALSRRPEGIAGYVMSSPFFGFKIKVPKWKTVVGRLLSEYIPALSIPTNLDPNTVSHDPATIDEYATAPRIGRHASARWLTETESAHASAAAAAGRLEMPILLQMAGADQIVCASAARSIFERVSSPDATWEEYPGFFHEIWFELERQSPLASLQEWLKLQVEARR